MKSISKLIYGFFLFTLIKEVSSSYQVHMSCSINKENFESLELLVNSQRLCESNIMGWTSPISLMIFLERSSIHSSCSFASSSSSESSTLAPLLFFARREKKLVIFFAVKYLLASNIREPSTFLAFLVDWDTLLASALWPVCSPRSNNLVRYCFWHSLNLFLCAADDLSVQPFESESVYSEVPEVLGLVARLVF